MSREFKEGEFIVLLRPDTNNNYISKYGWCYKVCENGPRLKILEPQSSSGQMYITGINAGRKDWYRYATKSEIERYRSKDSSFKVDDPEAIDFDLLMEKFDILEDKIK